MAIKRSQIEAERTLVRLRQDVSEIQVPGSGTRPEWTVVNGTLASGRRDKMRSKRSRGFSSSNLLPYSIEENSKVLGLAIVR